MSVQVKTDGEFQPIAGPGGGDPMIEVLPTPSLGWPASATKIVLPDDVTGGINDYAFYGHSSLTELVLPSRMTGGIGSNAFRWCSSLTGLVLPSGMTGGIHTSTFEGCSSLTELVLPSGMTGSIGPNAFNGCSSLTEITLLSPTVRWLNNTNAFIDCPANIYVPADLVDSYKSAGNWSTYADRIFGISELPD